MKYRFTVTGMSCSACAARVEQAVSRLPGVHSASVNLSTADLSVRALAGMEEKITKAVLSLGFKVQARSGLKHADDKPVLDKSQFIISLIFTLPLVYIAMGHMLRLPFTDIFDSAPIPFAIVQLILTAAVFAVNRRYFIRGAAAATAKAANMDTLVAMGAAAAFVYSTAVIISAYVGGGIKGTISELYFDSAAMILTLVTLGKYLESRAKSKAGDAVQELMKLAPMTALIEHDGKETTVPTDSLQTGDIVIIRPGGHIPVDGQVIEGEAAVDESAFTGESMPVTKKTGDFVLCATINKSGFLKVKTTKTGDQTALSKMALLVEDAAASKAPIARLADKISLVFVPIVAAIALTAAVIWLIISRDIAFAMRIGISVLVISCPCALGLATPVAITVAAGRGGILGVLYKSASAIESAAGIKAVVMDKTGTLTFGEPCVCDVTVACAADKSELLQYAAALERGSEHPVAKGILSYAQQNHIQPTVKTAAEFEALGGLGIAAVIDGVRCIGGNSELMSRHGIDLSAYEKHSDKLAQEAKTPVYFAKGAQLLGIIAVRDKLRSQAKEVVARFKGMGMEVHMLTGDNRIAARVIAEELGINNVAAEVLPGDKHKYINALTERGIPTAMIGDGINDAPALAAADVGIAIGAGTDIAISSADIVLVKNDLESAVAAIDLGRRTIINIKENLFWAFIYNIIGIPIAAGALYGLFGVLLSPILAAAAMSASSLFVVSNALRLRFYSADPQRKG